MYKENQGLYTPQFEHDACGIGFIANLKGQKSFSVISDAITMLENLEHRGGTGSESNTGDGAGILIQNPHDFFVQECRRLGFELPAFGEYGVGLVFFPKDSVLRERCREAINRYIKKFDFQLLGYRKVPTNNSTLGQGAIAGEPCIEQIFVKAKISYHECDAFERRLFVFRKHTVMAIRKEIPQVDDSFHIVCLSYKTTVYKGQLNSTQMRSYFPDLCDERMKSAIALIHSRFSTNTFPNWKLAQPFRFIAHNGEINTIRGNINWMKSYQTLFRSSLFTKEEIELILPLLDEKQSDSSNVDKIVELLLLGGRSLPHVMMMLIPEAYENDAEMDDIKKAFYEYHGSLIEPWDGPASICFTDGKIVGAVLDRNGLRPSRYIVTDDDRIIMASEVGALPVEQSKIIYKGRLEPGKIFIADLEQGRIISDDELKKDICSRQPYREWLNANSVHIDELPNPKVPTHKAFDEDLLQKQIAAGMSYEDLKVILTPMFSSPNEPIGSMGADTPLACISEDYNHITHYFKQLFAQVSNPPMDSTRESLVMSLYTSVGKTLDILGEKPTHCIQIEFPQPVLTNNELDKIITVEHPNFRSRVIDAVFEANGEQGSLEKAISRICQEAEDAIRYGSCNILILSDRGANSKNAGIPSLLAMGAVHCHLINTGLRVRVGIIVEAADVWETHHFATLIGYGANAINPYIALESLKSCKKHKLVPENLSEQKAYDNYFHAVGHGLLKIFAKMGISTLRSYHGSQIFEIIGLSGKVVEKCFHGTVSRIEGLDFDDIARETLMKQNLAYNRKNNKLNILPTGGIYQWKRKGEGHLFNPESLYLLQHAVRSGDYEIYKQFSKKINDQSEKLYTLRGMFDFKKRKSIMVEEVEPVESILKRFATGAMSFGSISYEAHSTLAIAMNKIGARSNSGEGGEDDVRFERKANGDLERSSVKQVASGRFGVSSYYLANADELQIKIAQGAKPGEGGQLPGHKVDDWIGRVRNSTPGVGLISPPPHHDIYSIEDLKQLIFDLKNANRNARISVKLVAEVGVGTIAAGVAKAHADVVLISGYDGGTGASPLSSVRHAGLPWELGLSETHQTLVKNNLRSRITVQTDGQLRTGRDIAIAALLGAEEWGVATAALVAMGCLIMRKCHSNTCPVGIATQDTRLRKLFTGKPEHVVNYFTFMAQELREIMAELGFHTVNEMIGQADMLKVRENIQQWKAQKLDLSKILYKEPAGPEVGLYKQIEQDHEIDHILDWKLIQLAKPALDQCEHVYHELPVINVNRALGTMLSYEISKKYKGVGLPEGTIHFKFQGSAGQSFGAFGANGLRLELEGDANDYFGKGLSGAELIIYPAKNANFDPKENVIIGNVAFYGAINGQAFIRGLAGQRFCVRNSGVRVVVEGVGAHGCEYMTGGVAIILGETGRNFAAGMSGGVAYVLDQDGAFKSRCNTDSIDFDPLEQEDIEIMKGMIEKHHIYTQSDIAAWILSDWENSLKKFVKVMPKDYKTVLLKKKQAILESAQV